MRIDNSKQSWLSVYIYHAKSLDNFLVEVIYPFICLTRNKSYISQYFFIRYWEDGPHIRLRFKGNKELLDCKLKPQIKRYFSKYNKQTRKKTELIKRFKTTNFIHFAEYEPELERYGGAKGLVISENHFQASSDVVLEILKLENGLKDNLLGIAIQLNFILAINLNFTDNEIAALYSGIYNMAYNYTHKENNIPIYSKKSFESFESNFLALQTTLVHIYKAFREIYDKNLDLEDSWINRWIIHSKKLCGEFKNCIDKNELILPSHYKTMFAEVTDEKKQIFFLLQSFIHMTNNRLGIPNIDEPYIAFLIKRTIEEYHTNQSI